MAYSTYSLVIIYFWRNINFLIVLITLSCFQVISLLFQIHSLVRYLIIPQKLIFMFNNSNLKINKNNH